MIPTITVSVETSDRYGSVQKIRGRPATYQETHYMKDHFKEILGDGQARISVGIDEKFNGPAGTYSSVGIRVNVTLACDQSSETVAKASDLAFEYASDFLDRHSAVATKLLVKHLEDMDRG